MRADPIIRDTRIGDRLRYTADELSLLSDQLNDAVARLDNGCNANSTAMIRSAHL